MQVGKDHVRIVLETVEDAVTVVRIDVDVGNAPEAVAAPGRLDGDTAVVEDAKTGRRVARRVVKPADRDERARDRARHDRLQRIERAADHERRILEDARVGRRVAEVEETAADARHFDHAIDIARRMKVLKFLARGLPRRNALKPVPGVGLLDLVHERVVARAAEGMAIGKTVRSDLLTANQNGCR